MTDPDEFDASTEQRILATWKALWDGKLNVAPQFQGLADELMAAPLTMIGLVDTSHLSETVLSFCRNAGMALLFAGKEREADICPATFSIADAQSELFRLFSQLFGAFTGKAVELIVVEEEIRERVIWRVRHKPDAFAKAVNSACDELAEFYNANATDTFRHAKSLGGMRLVTGGQRTFGPSALNGVRITGLYADTQLIPDPIFPFLSTDLHLNAEPLQLAIALFHILQLRPLVDAELPVPPVLIFPSFEESLEERDAHTKHGIEQLAIRMVGPLCEGRITSMEELFGYAGTHGDTFSQAVMASGLFVPPGRQPDGQLSAADAVRDYIGALEGIRSNEIVKQMKRLPIGVLLLNGVIERLRPHYHLLENANELGAQPLLSQRVHWHYFEKCAQANAKELRLNNVLSEQAFQTLRAVQDDSLSWLANIPVQTLAELISNNEHRWFREELNRYTIQLSEGGAINADEMVREISHGLASLVQRQQKALNEIERKYASRKASVYLGGAAGVGLTATVAMLPSLSPLLGVGLPAVAAIGTAGGAALGFGKEKLGELLEKRQAKCSILGVLATARPR